MLRAFPMRPPRQPRGGSETTQPDAPRLPRPTAADSLGAAWLHTFPLPGLPARAQARDAYQWLQKKALAQSSTDRFPGPCVAPEVLGMNPAPAPAVLGVRMVQPRAPYAVAGIHETPVFVSKTAQEFVIVAVLCSVPKSTTPAPPLFGPAARASADPPASLSFVPVASERSAVALASSIRPHLRRTGIRLRRTRPRRRNPDRVVGTAAQHRGGE
jgi:hypothetical protein